MFTLLMEFARTPGAKDKKPRKKRNLIAEGAGAGSLALAAANPRLKRQQSLLNKEKYYLDYKDYDTKRRLKDAYDGVEWAKQIKKEGYPLEPDMEKGLEKELARAKVRNARRNKKLQPRIAQNTRELKAVKMGKKISKYGAIGLAGVAGLELARRGIKRIRNKNKG